MGQGGRDCILSYVLQSCSYCKSFREDVIAPFWDMVLGYLAERFFFTKDNGHSTDVLDGEITL